MNKIYNNIAKAGVIATTLGLLLMAAPVGAHVDPVGCDSNGVGLSLTVLRSDGTTTVASSGGTIQSGETVKYRATLSHLGGTNCNFEQGTLTITTPDGVAHVVASGGGIPLVTFGVPFVAPLQDYVASEANASGDGDFDASAAYTNGIAHVDADEQSAGANTNIETPFQDSALEVTKTATPVAEETYEWTINKSVNPAVWNLFNGDSGTSEYTIDLVKSLEGTTYSVSGTITIHNPSGFADAVITGVSDVVSGVGSMTVVCPETFPYNLPAGQDLVCTYSGLLPDNTTRTNTATATTSGDVGGDSGTADVDFTNVVPTIVNGSVNVDDTYNAGDNGPFSGSTSYTYKRTFVCGAGQGEYQGTNNVVGNTATIIETQDSDSASVTVNCYDLSVTKDADTTFTRTYDWDVNKVADQTELTLAEGEHYLVNYTVTASVVGQVDSNWHVTGTITVHNPAPISATINSVSDVISGPVAGNADCGLVVFPYTLGSGADLVCTYSADLPNGNNRTNTATASQQNYDYDELLVATPDGTTDYSGNANVTFGAPTTVVDEEVTVTDSYAGVLGTATVAESPKNFNYSRDVFFEGEGACGDHNVDNTATVTTNDTQTVDTDDATVLVHIDCFLGCTLTQGYWKTHNDSFKGGAPTDDGWENIGPSKELTLFFNSGKTWFNVFWTAPKGNAYYSLAHQYMAAKLNVLNGASATPAVDAAIAGAEALFDAQGAGDTTLTKPETVMAKGFAGTLGSYNEGLIGPGHCDEQNPPL